MYLSDLQPHDHAKIKAVLAQGEIKRRLLDLGLIKGVSFKVLRKAPLGDPIEICIKNFCFALRLEEARTISVEKLAVTAPSQNPAYLITKQLQHKLNKWLRPSK